MGPRGVKEETRSDGGAGVKALGTCGLLIILQCGEAGARLWEEE